MAHNILDAFDKAPSRDVVTVLLVGSQGVGKRTLAKALVETGTDFYVHVRTATGFPLPATPSTSRPRIDFICFMLDLRSKDSVKSLETSLHQVDIEYFLGRSCLMAIQGENPITNIIDIEAVEEIALKFGLKTMFVKSTDPTELTRHAKRIIQLAQIAAGFKKYVTPALIETSRDISYLT